MPLPDYYEILQVRPDADQAAIRAAYRRLAKAYHPDFNQDPEAALRMQEINAAYEVLGDRVKRRSYDAARAVQLVLAGEAAAARWEPAAAPDRARRGASYEPPELTEDERRRVAARSEIRRRWPRRGGPAVARCYRCNFLWSLHGEPPSRCPYCHRRDWDRYRVFQCARCGHVWDSSTLQGAATAVFPACPHCGTLAWHAPTVRRRRRMAALRRGARAAVRPLVLAGRLLALLLRPPRRLLRLAWRGIRWAARALGRLLRRAALALAGTAAVLFLPTVASETAVAGPNGAVLMERRTERLIESGLEPAVAVVLALALLLAAGVAAGAYLHVRRGLARGRGLLWACTAVLLVGVILTALSVGLFFAPSALAALAAAVAAAGGAPGAPPAPLQGPR